VWILRGISLTGRGYEAAVCPPPPSPSPSVAVDLLRRRSPSRGMPPRYVRPALSAGEADSTSRSSIGEPGEPGSGTENAVGSAIYVCPCH